MTLYDKAWPLINEQGWDEDTVQSLLWEYVENQQDDDALLGFLQRKAEDENAAAAEAEDAEMLKRLEKAKAPQHAPDWED